MRLISAVNAYGSRAASRPGSSISRASKSSRFPAPMPFPRARPSPSPAGEKLANTLCSGPSHARDAESSRKDDVVFAFGSPNDAPSGLGLTRVARDPVPANLVESSRAKGNRGATNVARGVSFARGRLASVRAARRAANPLADDESPAAFLPNGVSRAVRSSAVAFQKPTETSRDVEASLSARRRRRLDETRARGVRAKT